MAKFLRLKISPWVRILFVVGLINCFLKCFYKKLWDILNLRLNGALNCISEKKRKLPHPTVFSNQLFRRFYCYCQWSRDFNSFFTKFNGRLKQTFHWDGWISKPFFSFEITLYFSRNSNWVNTYVNWNDQIRLESFDAIFYNTAK